MIQQKKSKEKRKKKTEYFEGERDADTVMLASYRADSFHHALLVGHKICEKALVQFMHFDKIGAYHRLSFFCLDFSVRTEARGFWLMAFSI